MSPISRIVSSCNTVTVHVGAIIVHTRGHVNDPHPTTAVWDLIAFFQPCCFGLVPVSGELTSPSLNLDSFQLTLVGGWRVEQELERFTKRYLTLCAHSSEQDLRASFSKNIGELSRAEICGYGTNGKISSDSAERYQRPDHTVGDVQHDCRPRCMNGFLGALGIGDESRWGAGEGLKGSCETQAIGFETSPTELRSRAIMDENGPLLGDGGGVKGVIGVLVGKVVGVVLEWVVEEEGVKVLVLGKGATEAAADG